MRGWWVLFLVACNSEPRSLPEPLAALEDVYTRTPASDRTFEIDDAILGPTGLFVRGARRATYMDLAMRVDGALAAAPEREEHSLVVMPGAPPAALVAVMGAAKRNHWQRVRLGAFESDNVRTLCRVKVPPLVAAPAPDEVVDLSIYIQADQIWIGLSRVNEFYSIPRTSSGADLVRLEEIMRQQKASAFFADRDDLDLGADPEVPLATLLAVIQIACTQFHEIDVVRPEQIHTRPTL